MLSPRRKKKIRRFLITTATLLLVITSGYITYQWLQYRKARFARYPEFGIKIPLGYELHGIDVSKYQSTIAWEEVKAMKVKEVQMSFAFIKATQGTGGSDPQFNRNWKKSRQAGVFRGAYHFFIPYADGKQQAENFIAKVELQKGDLPPVLDIEQLNGTTPEKLRAEAKKWLEAVEAHYGVKPIIYTNVDFYKRYLGDDFDSYPFWAAHYHSEGRPRIDRNWLFWQHSDQGRVNGITAAVDFNVFNGNFLDFNDLLID
jgi:lysozyme